MKKLMIAAAIVCAAAAVQAAAYGWDYQSASPVYAGYDAANVGDYYTGGNAVGAMAYLVYWDDEVGISQGELLTALRDGQSISQAAGEYLFTGNSEIGANGQIAKARVSDNGNNFTDEVDWYTSAYVAVISEDGKNVYLSDWETYVYNSAAQVGDATVDPGTSGYLIDKDGTTAFGDAGWYAISAATPTPEPTSGLLLLLGVAGLALRRRRA